MQHFSQIALRVCTLVLFIYLAVLQVEFIVHKCLVLPRSCVVLIYISTCLYNYTNWDKAAKRCRDKRSRDTLLTQNVNTCMTLGTSGCDQCLMSVSVVSGWLIYVHYLIMKYPYFSCGYLVLFDSFIPTLSIFVIFILVF